MVIVKELTVMAEEYLAAPYEPQTRTYPVVQAIYEDRPAGQASEWLRIIRQTNKLCDDAGEERIFGAPLHMGEWWAGGFEELYDEARVILPIGDGMTAADRVRIIPFTDRANRLIWQAFKDVQEGAEG